MSHKVKQVNVRCIDDAPVTIKTMARTIIRTLRKAVVSRGFALFLRCWKD